MISERPRHPGPGRAGQSSDGSGPVSGCTFQVGGEDLIACTAGLEDDRAWFARHHGRSHRIRKPLGAERTARPLPQKGFKRLVVVRQVRPGSRIRTPFDWRGPTPINSEAVAAQIFGRAARNHPNLGEFVRRFEEGAP